MAGDEYPGLGIGGSRVRHPRPARRRPAREPGLARGCGKISTHPPSPGHPAPHRRPAQKTRPDGQATCLNEVTAMTYVAAQRAAYGPGRTSLKSASRRAGLMAGECLIVAQVRPGDVRPPQQLDALALSPLPPPLDGGFQPHPSPNLPRSRWPDTGSGCRRAASASLLAASRHSSSRRSG